MLTLRNIILSLVSMIILSYLDSNVIAIPINPSFETGNFTGYTLDGSGSVVDYASGNLRTLRATDGNYFAVIEGTLIQDSISVAPLPPGTTDYYLMSFDVAVLSLLDPMADPNTDYGRGTVSLFRGSDWIGSSYFHAPGTVSGLGWTSAGLGFRFDTTLTENYHLEFISPIGGSFAIDNIQFQRVDRDGNPVPEPVPEPTTILLLGTGLALIGKTIYPRNKNK